MFRLTRLLTERSVRVRLLTVLGVSLCSLFSVLVVSLRAQSDLDTAATKVAQMATLTHEVDTINYYNADMSGWLVSFAWDADFMGGAKAVEPASIDRAGFLADKPLLTKALDGAHTAWMTPTERTLFDDMRKQWVAFFELDTKIVSIYQENTPDAIRRARDVIQNDQYAVYFKIVDDATKLATSIQARGAATQAAVHHSSSVARQATLIAAAVGMLIAGGLTWLVIRSILIPLRRVSHVIAGLAEGDLTRTAAVTGHDEIGTMAQGLDSAASSLRAVMGTLTDNATSLEKASSQLTGVSGDLLHTVEQTAGRTSEVSEGSNEVSHNIQTIAAGAEQMSSSIAEIAHNAQQAAGVGAQASEIARSANETVSKLDSSSAEVGNILKAITAIAEQTNLLALNATIEAARAGEAGKGFAVVASEVKDLAQETARATEDISSRIDAIQNDTHEAISAIGSITEIIGRLGDYQTTIASAVEEQTATAGQMSHSVADAASTAGDIAEGVSAVALASRETTKAVGGVQHAASELTEMSTQLRQVVASFRV